MKPGVVRPEHYDCLIAGATFLGAAAALTLADAGLRCLVTDRAMMPGHEFSYAFKDGVCPRSGLTPPASELLDELAARGAVSEEGIPHLPALTPVLARRLCARERGIVFYPLTCVTAAEYNGGEWRLVLCSPGRRRTVYVRDIVDTSADPALSSVLGVEAQRVTYSLNAAVAADTVPERAMGGDAPEIVRGCFPGEYYAHFGAGENIARLRARVPEYLKSHPDDNFRVISVAEEPQIDCEPVEARIAPGVLRAPSAAYGNAVEAYDAGVRFAGLMLDESVPEKPVKRFIPSVKQSGKRYDVIVAGLGTAGAVTALCAARGGLRVLGLEEANAMGGVGTVGAIATQYLGFRGGAYAGVDRDAQALFDCGFAGERGEGCTVKAFALESACRAAEAEYRYGATVTDAVLSPDGRRVLGVRWLESDGMHEAAADYTVDATADGLVCIAAGCEMQGGRESDGGFQLYSNVQKYYNNKKKLSSSRNQDDGTVNQYDTVALGRAVLTSLTSPLHLPDRYTGGGDERLLGPAYRLGIREGRRICGEETVTLPDITAGRFTRQPVFFEYANLDNHGKDTAFEDRFFRDWIEICSLWDCRIAIPVPAGALIPRGYYGILAAGRCISVDHSTAFAVRMKDAMQKCGEAAALMLIRAGSGGGDVRDIDYTALRRELLEAGVLGGNECAGAYYHDSEREKSWKRDIFELSRDRKRLYSRLCSDEGGAAVMAAAIALREERPDGQTGQTGQTGKTGNAGETAENGIYSMLTGGLRDHGAGVIQLNCALALCLAGCGGDATGVICAAITDRSGIMPHTSYTFNFPYAVSAISAAGRAGMTAAVPYLLEIVKNPSYADDIPICDTVTGKTKLITCRGDMRHIYRTQALAALREICRAHPEQLAAVRDGLAGMPRDLGIEPSVSLIGRSDGTGHDLSALIQAYTDEIRCANK